MATYGVFDELGQFIHEFYEVDYIKTAGDVVTFYGVGEEKAGGALRLLPGYSVVDIGEE